jgi:hypothetical protein
MMPDREWFFKQSMVVLLTLRAHCSLLARKHAHTWRSLSIRLFGQAVNVACCLHTILVTRSSASAGLIAGSRKPSGDDSRSRGADSRYVAQ